jgi:DNA repair exonuclease SbcCD ATPase subunit
MIELKKVTWKNFLSTGNSPNTVELNRSLTTLIVGKNGEGKSTILDALCFGLFGKPFRNINKNQLINSINLKNCLVEIEFSIGSAEYKIIRGIKPNIFEIYQGTTLLNQDSASRDYQKILEQQILKLNYKTFTQVVILGSASFVPFMQLPSNQRKDVIEDILDIRIFSTMNTLLKEKSAKSKMELLDVESTLSKSRAEVDAQQKLIKSLVQSKNEYIDSIQQKITANNLEISTITTNIEGTNVRVDALRESIKDRTDVEEGIDKLINSLNRKKEKNTEIDTHIEFFVNNDSCPSCAQDIPHEHKSTIVDKMKLDAQSNADFIQKIDEALVKLRERMAEIKKVQDEIMTLTSEVSSYNSSITLLNKQNTSLQQEIEEAKENTANIDEEKTKLKELAAKALECINTKTALLEQRNLEEVASTLLKDTGIKTAIIREYLPAMNKLINMYLQAMDFFVHFELDESFNEVIKSRYRDEFTYASFSEGEKMRIDLAILFTWRQIAKMKNSVNTNLLILDEIFDSSLDTSGTDYFLSVMSQLGERSNTFVISHKGDQLFDKFRSVIKFEKRNDFSVIVSP